MSDAATYVNVDSRCHTQKVALRLYGCKDWNACAAAMDKKEEKREGVEPLLTGAPISQSLLG